MFKRSVILIRKILLLASASLVFTLLSACSDSTNTSTVNPASELVFYDTLGHEIRLNTTPQRIIAAAPSLTEIACALGLESKLVGITNFCDYPPSIKNLPSIGTYSQPSIESILSLNPDLVIVVFNGPQKTEIEKLRELGCKVAVLKASTFQDITHSIRWLSSVMGIQSRGEALASTMENNYKAIYELLKNEHKPKVLYSIAITPIITVGGSSYIQELITTAGATNIFGDLAQPYPQVSLESIIEREPDIILYGSDGMGSEADQLAQTNYWMQWQNLPAVQNNKLTVVKPDTIVRPGPRIVEGLAQLASRIHPHMESEIRKIQNF